MNTNLIDISRNMVHEMSIVLFGVIAIVLVISALKPQLFKRVFREFSERKYILTAGIFISLLNGTVFFATQPTENTFVSKSPNQIVGVANPINEANNNTQQTVKTEEVNVREPIAYDRQQQDDPALAAGQTKLIQSGKEGQKQLTYTVTYHRETEVSRKLTGEQVITQPTPEIIAIGSQGNQQPTSNDHNESKQNHAKSRPLMGVKCGNDKDSSPRICLRDN